MRHLVRCTLFSLLVAAAAAAPVLAHPAPPARGASGAPARSLLDGLEIFQIEPAHSPIEFSVPFMGLSHVRGVFADYSGAIALDRKDVTRSSVTVVIRTASLTTFNALRDRDLKGPAWFDVEKHPLAVFTSSEIVKQGDGYILRGNLELHGITKAIEIPVALTGRFKGPGGDEVAGFEGRATLDRRDYGIVGPARYNVLLQIGQAMVGDAVDLPVSVEAFHPVAVDTLSDRVADSLCRVVMARGAGPVASDYRSLRATTPDSLMRVTEGHLNVVALQLVERGRAADGLELFKLEAEMFPRSASGPSGLAYAYACLGDRANAIASAERAVAMNPAAARALEILRRVKPGA